MKKDISYLYGLFCLSFPASQSTVLIDNIANIVNGETPVEKVKTNQTVRNVIDGPNMSNYSLTFARSRGKC